MQMPRRQFLTLAAASAALPFVPRMGWAEAYPARPVHLIVGFPPGGVNDTVARLVGQRLTERFGQSFVVENRPGAAGNTATETVARAPADGYTLLVLDGAATINATLYAKPDFDLLRDVAPIATVMRGPLVLVVNPSVPAATVAELIAYAKANPNKLSMASPGNGTPSHVAGELFNMMAGIETVHVPYRGGAPALSDLLGGHVQLLVTALPPAVPHIKAGKLRALAVTGPTRLEMLPNVPTLGETIPGFEASLWLGIAGPKNLPDDVVKTLNLAIEAAVAEPDVKARLAELGGTPLSTSPAEFGKLIGSDVEKWAKVIAAANVKPD